MRSLLSLPFLTVLGVLVLAALALYGGFLAGLSWIVVIAISAVAGFLAVRSAERHALQPEPLSSPRGDGGATAGALRALAHILDRARRGYAYSQTLVRARVASAFLEKVRLARGLSPSEIERARGDRTALRELIGDPVLADFVFENERYTRELPSQRVSPADRESFPASLSRVLDAMEGWS